MRRVYSIILKFKALICLCPLLLLISLGVRTPFVGPYGNQSASYSLQAQNYLKFGYQNLRLAPLDEVSVRNGSTNSYYLHHPPGLQILISIFQKFLGANSIIAVRLPFILGTIATVILLGEIARLFFGDKFRIVTYVLSSTIPMIVSFANLIQFEILLLPIVLATILIYLRILKSPSPLKTVLLACLLLIGLLIDWPMVFFSVYLGVGNLVNKRKNLKLSLLLFTIPLLFVGVYYIYTVQVLGDSSYLLKAFYGRTISTLPFNLPNPLVYFSSVFLIRFLIYFTPLSALGVIYFYWVGFKISQSINKIVYLILGLFGVTNLILFPNGAYIHPYWAYYLIPPVIIGLLFLIKSFWAGQRALRFFLIIAIFVHLVASGAVIYFKDQQVRKAVWQQEFVAKLGKVTTSHDRILVNWDFNTDLIRFDLHRNVDSFWQIENPRLYLQNNLGRYDYLIYSCWTNCPPQAVSTQDSLKANFQVVFSDPENHAQLFDLHSAVISEGNKNQNTMRQSPTFPKQGKLTQIYKQVRDYFVLEQI